MLTTPLEILFQSPDFLAIDKPVGVSVHNNEDVENLLSILDRQLGLGKLFPVHRLDKETSGVQLFALNEVTARTLADAFQTRSVKKTYVGVLRGHLKQAQGLWSHALSDKAEGRKTPAGLGKDRVACETGFKVLKQSQYFSLCEFDLRTGRQHQIRKHAALANHALVGDPRYGDPKYNKKIAGLYKQERMYLHCARLEIAGEIIEAGLPSEFEQLF